MGTPWFLIPPLHCVPERELGAVPAQVREAQPLEAEAAAEEAEEERVHAVPAGAARVQGGQGARLRRVLPQAEGELLVALSSGQLW